MTPPSASPEETVPLAAQAPEGADFARPVLERQVARLDRLADIGMEIAEDLRRITARAAEPGGELVDRAAVTLAFSRVSRAVRMTSALQTEVLDKLRGVGRIEDYAAREARRTAQDAARAVAVQDEVDPRLRARKDEIASAVTAIIGEKHRDAEGGEAHERCIRKATERLKDADDLGDILARPFDEVVAQICRELGLSSRGGEGGMSPSPWMDREAEARSSQRGSGGRVAPCPEKAPRVTPYDASPAAYQTHSPQAEPLPPRIPAVGFASASQSPIQGERIQEYTAPPDPDTLPGYAVGLPGELPPDRGRRRASLPPRNYTHGFD